MSLFTVVVFYHFSTGIVALLSLFAFISTTFLTSTPENERQGCYRCKGTQPEGKQ